MGEGSHPSLLNSQEPYILYIWDLGLYLQIAFVSIRSIGTSVIMLRLVHSTLRCSSRMLSRVLWLAPSKRTGALCGIRLTSSVSSLEDCLKVHFDKVMKCDHIPLLKDFDVYKRSLPVRRDASLAQELPLYQLPYWTNDEDMEFFADQLQRPPISRASVKYLSAPSGSGKTSCILPAFLKSTHNKGGFTHYLYLAFSNNDDNFFRASTEVNQSIALEQGTSFIFECLKILLESPDKDGIHNIPCSEDPPNYKDIRNTLEEYIHKIVGPDQRLLLHLDEHRQMCPRYVNNPSIDDELDKGAMFSRGAMSGLSKIPRVTVIATYTARPPLPAHASSGVRRDPVAKPILNIDAAMQEIGELRFPHSQDNFNRNQKRLWATLCFRLGMKLREYGLISLHSRANIKAERLLQNFKEAAGHPDTMEALKKCIELCTIRMASHPTKDPNAIKLLLGVEDEEVKNLERQIQDLVVLESENVTSSLQRLLNMYDPNYKVYSKGRDHFATMLTSDDYLSNTPLEAAYYWSLSCRSAVSEQLVLRMKNGYKAFKIECKDLVPGRLFPQHDTSIDFNMDEFEPDVMYYVVEGAGKVTHPLCDIFFRTAEGEFVLVDITGGGDTQVEEKKGRLSQWIEHNQHKFPYTLHGVVLAPLATGGSMTHHDCVHAVCGGDARELLGGLSQVFRWLK